jgi:hypothetical protein
MKSRADTRTMHVCVGIVDRLTASMLSFEKRLTHFIYTKPTIHCAILWNYGGGGQTQLKGCLSITLELDFTESAWCNKHPSRSGACTNYLSATRLEPSHDHVLSMAKIPYQPHSGSLHPLVLPIPPDSSVADELHVVCCKSGCRRV